jgi:hypothetical protein
MQHIAGCETAKGQLPAVLFAGEFDHTSDGGLRKHSGLIVLDFNALDKQEVVRLKKQLAEDPHTVLAITSAIGHGVTWVLATNATDETSHTRCWEMAVKYALNKFSRHADGGGEDVGHECLLSHDPSLVLRAPAERLSLQDIKRHNALTAR